MPAIVTNDFRTFNALQFVESFTEPAKDYFYAFLSRSIAWPTVGITSETNPPLPYDNIEYINGIRQQMMGAKRILGGNISMAIHRRDWTAGKYYNAWRHDYGDGATQARAHSGGSLFTPTSLQDSNLYFYCISHDKVYLCLNAPTSGPSVNDPDNYLGNAGEIIDTADGYLWKLIAVPTAEALSKFKTAEFFPVSDSGDTLQDTAMAYSATKKGGVYVVKINGETAGSGFPADTTVTGAVAAGKLTVVGDGSGFECTIQTTGTGISKIIVTNPGAGYSYLSLRSGTGTTLLEAETEAILTSKSGLGADPVKDLCSTFVVCNASFDYNENGKFPAGENFRSIGIIRGALKRGSSTVYGSESNQDVAQTCYKVRYTGTTPVIGNTYTASNGPTVRVVDVRNEVDTRSSSSAANYAFVNILKEDNINNANYNKSLAAAMNYGTFTVADVISPDIDPFSGDILYVENRRRMPRDISQREEVTFVVEF